MTDGDLMRRALALAERGRGWVDPNPMVGAIVVRDGAIVGEGHHQKVGGPHAEVVALGAAGAAAEGATLYVTLEPCNHHGRTPPCTDAVIRAGIRKVVLACWDENPLTAGQSRTAFEGAGIEVVAGVEEIAARALNAPFFKYVRTGMPFVLCKVAMSLDGKIATAAGKSQWISGPEARAMVQEWRGTYSGVMVGIGTVLADDPSLRCRLEGAHPPARIVVDPLGDTPAAARFLGDPGRAIVAVGPEAPPQATARLRAAGAAVVTCPTKRSADGTPGEFLRTSVVAVGGVRTESDGRTGAESTDGASKSCIGRHGASIEGIDLTFLMGKLSQMGVSSVMVEGGGGLCAALVRQGLVDRVAFFVAPLLIGGRGAPTPMDGSDVAELSEAIALCELRARPVGADFLLEGEIQQA